ncbi:MAG: NAD-dependent epimerase/dehydratase family protein, partial [bacterium]
MANIKNRTDTILVTGAAGFIGFHLCSSLLKRGCTVIGVDNINSYYDVDLKYARLKKLGINQKNLDNLRNNNNLKTEHDKFKFYKIDICDLNSLRNIFDEAKINKVCHLAAQAGVRYSLINPFAYEESNLKGFLNIIDQAKENKVDNFVYASSSSVYGGNKKFPFSESDPVDEPVSLYAATKKSNELIAYTYSHLFRLPCTGLRFFTVYGPWGRPDMALFMFTMA